MLMYLDGTYFAILNTHFETVPTFLEAMVKNRLGRLGAFPYFFLEENGNIRITVRVHENATHMEIVKKELEQIIEEWS